MSTSTSPESRSVLSRGSACLRCKRNKRKCDASKPACSECRKAGRIAECIYSSSPGRQQADFRGTPYEVLRWGSPRPTSSGSSMVAEVLILDHSVDWWRHDELPPPLSEFLVMIFLNHTPQVHFEEIAPSIIARMSRFAPSHPSHPHPSLLNSMYLIASLYLSSPSHPSHIEQRVKWNPSDIELSFLQKARRLMFTETAQPHNYFDFLLAMGLITRYFCWSKRTEEGHDEGISTMRLAMACNLHHISSLSVARYPSSVLPPPETRLEVRDRMNAFWQAFMMDRGRAIAWSREVTLRSDTIQTVFPPRIDHHLPFPSDSTGTRQNTVASLIGSRALDASYDTIYVMKIKCIAYLEIIGQITIRVQEEGTTKLNNLSEALYADFCAVETAFIEFNDVVPRTLPAPSPTAILTTFECAMADLTKLRTMCKVGTIRLHRPFITRDEESRAKCLSASKEIVEIARDMAKTNEIYWQIPVHFGWNEACQVFQLEISRILQGGRLGLDDEWMVLQLRNDMEYLAMISRRFLKVYPFHRPASLSVIEQLLAKDSHAIDRLTAAGDSR